MFIRHILQLVWAVMVFLQAMSRLYPSLVMVNGGPCIWNELRGIQKSAVLTSSSGATQGGDFPGFVCRQASFSYLSRSFTQAPLDWSVLLFAQVLQNVLPICCNCSRASSVLYSSIIYHVPSTLLGARLGRQGFQDGTYTSSPISVLDWAKMI